MRFDRATEELCGDSFSASSISSINQGFDEALATFAAPRREEPHPYLILDVRYEKVCQGVVIHSRAVLIAISIHQGGRREVLATELAPREARPASATSF